MQWCLGAALPVSHERTVNSVHTRAAVETQDRQIQATRLWVAISNAVAVRVNAARMTAICVTVIHMPGVRLMCDIRRCWESVFCHGVGTVLIMTGTFGRTQDNRVPLYVRATWNSVLCSSKAPHLINARLKKPLDPTLVSNNHIGKFASPSSMIGWLQLESSKSAFSCCNKVHVERVEIYILTDVFPRSNSPDGDNCTQISHTFYENPQ